MLAFAHETLRLWLFRVQAYIHRHYHGLNDGADDGRSSGTTGIAKLNDIDMEFSVWVHLAVLRIDKEWLLPRYLEMALNGCVATFQKRQESDWSSWPGSVSCRHLEQVVDELNLSPHIRTAHPPRLPLPDHVHVLVALDRSPRRVECTKALLGLHASFDRSMILLHDVVQATSPPF